MNILFICTLGRMRSKTAASLFKGSKYAGTDSNADVKVTQELMDWADKIVCMENSHRSKLRRKFKGYSHKMEVWNIEDIYDYGDDSLVAILQWEYERRGYYGKTQERD